MHFRTGATSLPGVVVMLTFEHRPWPSGVLQVPFECDSYLSEITACARATVVAPPSSSLSPVGWTADTPQSLRAYRPRVLAAVQHEVAVRTDMRAHRQALFSARPTGRTLDVVCSSPLLLRHFQVSQLSHLSYGLYSTRDEIILQAVGLLAKATQARLTTEAQAHSMRSASFVSLRPRQQHKNRDTVALADTRQSPGVNVCPMFYRRSESASARC